MKRSMSWFERLRIRLTLGQDRQKRRLRRFELRTRRVMTVALGAALSVGGVTEVFHGASFVVVKDLDQVQLVRRAGTDQNVVAELGSQFAGNSLFKIAKIVPDSLLAQEASLFQSEWIRIDLEGTEEQIPETIELVTDRVREEFFGTIPYGSLIHAKAQKYDVDPALVAAVMEAESRFRPRARSPRGAQGLMQLMPRTGRWMGAKNLYDPEQNVEAGVRYLKYLEKRFDGDLTKQIAAYNAGEGNVMRYGGVPPFRETRQYVKRVMRNYERRTAQLEKFEQSAAVAR